MNGLGDVLMQRDISKRLRAAANASRALSKAERNYWVTDLEAHAFV